MDNQKDINQDVIIPTTQKPKSNFLIILLILVGLFLTASFVYFGYQLSVSQKQKVTFPTPTPVKTPTDETTNWKTYRTNTLGFEFKYPNEPNWQVRETDNLVSLYNYDIDKAPGRDYDPVLDKDLFKIEIFVDSQNTDVDKWFESEKNILDPITGKPNEFLNIKNVTVDSQKGIYYKILSIAGLKVGSAVFESPKKELIHFNGGLSFEKYKEVFNQILMTLKFINQTPEGKFCGGIAGIPCPIGYRCKLDGNYPDAGGKCVKE